MKSVIAEANSIAKAIEQAWQKAGQPAEFLIKIFQEPQRSIFGLTKATAKIGLFFEDEVITQKIKYGSTLQPSSPKTTQIKPIKPIGPKPQPEHANQNKPALAQNPNKTNHRPKFKPEAEITKPQIEVKPEVAKTADEANPVEQLTQEPVNTAAEQTVKPKSRNRHRYYRRRKHRQANPGQDTQNSVPLAPTNEEPKN